MSYLALLVGLALLFGGGEAMLRGAVGLSNRLRLSPIFVGIAVVGFATSSPELFVSVDAAVGGRPEIALGNVIGSNTANLLLILGAGAAISQIRCRPAAIRRDSAMMTFACVAAAMICLNGASGRIIGAALFLTLIVYLWRAYVTERRYYRAQMGDEPRAETQSLAVLIAFVAGGLAALVFGAECLVYGAVEIAKAAGVSDRTISVSIVAIGTSLPELATAIVAARKGHSDVAIGNVFGSCVFNVFGILGVASMAAPIVFSPAVFLTDVGVMSLAAAGVLALALFTNGVSRLAGFGMLTVYGAYMAWLYIGPTP